MRRNASLNDTEVGEVIWVGPPQRSMTAVGAWTWRLSMSSHSIRSGTFVVSAITYLGRTRERHLRERSGLEEASR